MSSANFKIQPNPDFSRLEKVLLRQGNPDRVPFYELFSNIESQVLAVLGISPEFEHSGSDPESAELQRHITYMYSLGYDYVNVSARNFGFPQKARPTARTAEGERGYLKANTHTIANRNDYESYPWPRMDEIDYTPFERIAKILPEGMKAIALSPGGVLENVMWLLGYEGISYLFRDDPQFVREMFEAVASRLVAYFDAAASFDVVGALVLGDDMGFKTQTMLSPEDYREYVFPWHRRLVQTVHSHGKPAILHACGNLSEVMDDIIACGWDAKHSFEDDVMPVWQAREKYGDRIALLGGFDMDKMSRMSEEDVRRHTRYMIRTCAPGGGWALGTGNSVADYIPVKNFLAMLEEGFWAGKYGL
ncbi:uroporphyrinogen-III decarboxylase-like protein [candidate division KSB1 bacterium]|nr:uroporphyrinogen-III decarboxylase-like protein [candidate division KSB1 bacterium]